MSVSVAQRKSWQVRKNQEKTGLIWSVRQLRQTKNAEISKMNMLVQARKAKESSLGVLEDGKILEGIG
jgi:predicted nuclease of restriction endonuclease-like (RecB) superfamily